MDPNLMLYAASYPDETSAQADFDSLKAAQGAGEFAIMEAVVVTRGADGKVDVKEHGATATKGGAMMGGAAGLVVGLFAPPLLLATAAGAAIGAGIGDLVKRNEEKQLGVDVQDFIPPGSSAVVVVADDMYADRIDKTFAKSTKKINKAIDSGDYDKLNKALSDAGYDMSKAVNS